MVLPFCISPTELARLLENTLIFQKTQIPDRYVGRGFIPQLADQLQGVPAKDFRMYSSRMQFAE